MAVRGRAQRWPEWECPLCPCRGAQCLGLRGEPRASTSDPSCLSERSERSERSELHDAAHGASTAGCLERSGRTGAPGSPSFASFSWRSKKRESGCGGEAPTSSHRSREVVDRTHCVDACTWSRDVPPAVQSLSFVSPKESNQRKGDPGPHVPSLALRATCGARGLGASCNSLRSLRSLRSNGHDGSDVEARGSPRRPGHCAPRRGHRGGSGGHTRAIAALGQMYGGSP